MNAQVEIPLRETISGPRPNFTTWKDRLIHPVSEQMAQRFMDWNPILEDSQDEIEEWFEAYFQRNSFRTNGFEICKRLEYDFYCDPDSDLVEVMDSVDIIAWRLLEPVVRRWVETNQHEEFKEGEVVFVIHNNYINGEITSKVYSGTISSIFHKVWRFTIYIVELGHVKEGCGTHGIIKDGEDLYRTREEAEKSLAEEQR